MDVSVTYMTEEYYSSVFFYQPTHKESKTNEQNPNDEGKRQTVVEVY